MTSPTTQDRQHLELAFESSGAILALAGYSANKESKDLQQRIIAGELDFQEAVKIALHSAQLPLRRE